MIGSTYRGKGVSSLQWSKGWEAADSSFQRSKLFLGMWQ